MNKLTTKDIYDILKQAQLKVYEVNTPDNIDGIEFPTLTQFLKFLEDLKIDCCFLALSYVDADDYIISNEMVGKYINPDSDIGRIIISKVNDYNNSLNRVDFSIPENILVVALYQGKCFYFEHFNELLLFGEPLIEADNKLSEILNLFDNEIRIEIEKRNAALDAQMEKLRLYILDDPSFRLCRNKALRRDYVNELLRKKLGPEFDELKKQWVHDEIGYIYRGAYNLADLVWNELKAK